MLDGLRKRVVGWGRPAPMRDFADYDEYWKDRVTVGGIMLRWKLATEVLPDGASLLDVGCGSGEFLRYLKTQRPTIQSTGCDFSQESVSLTKAAGFEAFRLDLATDEIEGTFDYVTCFEVLEHIPEAEAAFEKLARACRRQLIVSVPNVGYIDSRIRLALFGRFPVTNCIYHVKEHVRHWTERDFREWVDHMGWRVDQVAAQYAGGRFLPVDRYPGLLSPGLTYVLSRKT